MSLDLVRRPGDPRLRKQGEDGEPARWSCKPDEPESTPHRAGKQREPPPARDGRGGEKGCSVGGITDLRRPETARSALRLIATGVSASSSIDQVTQIG